MTSISGLNQVQRHTARVTSVNAMLLLLHHAPAVHYSQGSERWSGIDKGLVAAKGQYPTECDCSASTSWALWNGLHVKFGVHDIVNGTNWKSGYTGTQAGHGREVIHHDRSIRADLVLYGEGPTFEHVAMVAGHQNGKLMVISQGSEPGPFLLPYDYRPDVGEIRRYI